MSRLQIMFFLRSALAGIGASALLLILSSCATGSVERPGVYQLRPAHSQSVLVLGSVIQQGAVPWHEGMTVKDCILAAGGFTQFAKSRQVRLVTFTAKKQWQEFDVEEIVVDFLGDSGSSPVTSGSVIIVPEVKVIY